jgi:hypothetical protein
LYRGVRLRAAAFFGFFCLSVLLSGAVAWAGQPVSDTGSAQGKEVTYHGCLYGGSGGWWLVVLEDGENINLELVGDTSALDKYKDSAALSVRGIRLSSRKLEVKHVRPLRLVAKLNKSLTDASKWIRKTDATYGLSVAFPKDASFGDEDHLSFGGLGRNSVRIFDASFRTYPGKGSDDAHLSIYVDTAAGEEDTRFACEHAVRMDDCFITTFHNHLSYRFDFSIAMGQPGMIEWGCLEPEISDEQENSFLRLFFSQVRFLKPQVPAADGRHISPTTVVPQIVRFEKTPLVRGKGGGSFSLSWKALNADYVRLSYNCGPRVQIRTGSLYQVPIEDLSFSRSCGDPGLPDVFANRPPVFSQKLTFGDEYQREPVTIQITLTPYSHGDPFAQSSKTLSLEVPLR